MDRREFVNTMKVSLGSAAAALVVSPVGGRAAEVQDSFAVLVDTTRCVGCRGCEYACAETNGLPDPDDNEEIFDTVRKTSTVAWSVINRFTDDNGDEAYVKRQCMHCLQPACGSACLTKAMHKTSLGPVIWRESKCMGCRFCMISCPFDMPKFEYHSAVPRLLKCRMCYEKVEQGGSPACVETCPAEALTFGTRSKMLRLAHDRMAEDPESYVDHIYGDREVGGSSWLYLAGRPFDELGFRTDLGNESFPSLTKGFLFTVPVVITLLPPFLLGLSRATSSKDGLEQNEKGVADE